MRDTLQAVGRLRRAYREKFGRELRLLRPRRFSEKMQWRKLFDRDPLHTILSDKLAVRDFIAARVGPKFLVPLLWSGQPDDIPFATLTYPCVLKSTHASGHVLMLMARDDGRRDEIVETARGWLAINYADYSGEPGYREVPPGLIIERVVTDEAGAAPEERRLFVFDGAVRCINTVFREDGDLRNGAFHTPDWVRLGWFFSRWVARDFPQPRRLDGMIAVAERLGHDLDHVRIDIFDCGDRFYVGEMTLYSWSGLSPFNSDAADLDLGANWNLRYPVLRALAATTGWRQRKRVSASPGP